jgi:hypothetical protein
MAIIHKFAFGKAGQKLLKFPLGFGVFPHIVVSPPDQKQSVIGPLAFGMKDQDFGSFLNGVLIFLICRGVLYPRSQTLLRIFAFFETLPGVIKSVVVSTAKEKQG